MNTGMACAAMVAGSAILGGCIQPSHASVIAFDYSDTPSSVYQWSVASHTPDEKREDGRAFLWIPENCERVAGVVVGQQNMLEEPIFECPAFREELAKANLGIVFIAPKQCGMWKFGDEEAAWFERLMSDLADESGYEELRTCPFAAIGHSAMAMWPYMMCARYGKGRAFAGVSLKGAWADRSKAWGSDAAGRGLAGVPFLLLDGEYEDAENRAKWTRDFCNAFPNVPFSFCAEDGAGHFDWSDELAHYLGVYFRKAIAWDGGDGVWLPRWKRYAVSHEPERYWYFDEEMARETEAMQERFRGQSKTPLVGYRYKGEELPQHTNEHLQVFIPFDGATRFSFEPMFTEDVLAGRLADWTGLEPGAKAPHPADESVLYVQKICGPCAKVGANEYELRFNRGCPCPKPGKAADICFQAVFPGDAEYQRAVQQARMRVHAPKEGAASAAHGYYIREGAATVNPKTGEVTFLPLPPRAKKPHRVTVVEWTWGGAEKEITAK